MPEKKLKPVVPGRANKPAWCRTHRAETGPSRRAGTASASLSTTEVYLDGALIGSITGMLKPGSTARAYVPDRLGAGVIQHGDARFHAIDALVRTHLTDVQQHPIAHLAAAA